MQSFAINAYDCPPCYAMMPIPYDAAYLKGATGELQKVMIYLATLGYSAPRKLGPKNSTISSRIKRASFYLLFSVLLAQFGMI